MNDRMDPAVLFTAANNLALVSWLLLLVLPRWKWTPRLVAGGSVTVLCLAYALMIGGSLSPGDLSKFGTLAGVMELFTQPGAVLIGWIHYLAFDLMTGLYISHNSQRLGIPHGWIILALIFTFMLGPVGLLIYWIIRMVRTRRYIPTEGY